MSLIVEGFYDRLGEEGGKLIDARAHVLHDMKQSEAGSRGKMLYIVQQSYYHIRRIAAALQAREVTGRQRQLLRPSCHCGNAIVLAT